MSTNVSHIHRSKQRARLRNAVAAAVVALLTTAAVAAAHTSPVFKTTMRVSPGAVSQGGRVTVSGDAGTPLRAGSTITLLSFAFASHYQVDGVPAIRTQVLVEGTYRATAKIQKGLRYTEYAIDASSNGEPLGPVVWLKVKAQSHGSPYFKTTMRVSPGMVRQGGRVTVSGDAGTPLRAGSTITLESFAFASRYHVDGVPAIRTQVFADGTYRATARIQTGLQPTDYAVDASSDGKPLGPIDWLNVC
jgi:hypothetical protein